VGSSAQTKAMKKVAGSIKLELAQYREMEAFAQFASDMDASTQKLLARGSRLVELLKQPQYTPIPMEEQVISIYAGVNGYLDEIDIQKISEFESGLISLIKSENKEILNSIRSEKVISEKIEKQLKTTIEDFIKTFN
tara:strand:- start:1436 stop:1846 length:411 start_codon:yes stop_codon:yes gene_type:complete